MHKTTWEKGNKTTIWLKENGFIFSEKYKEKKRRIIAKRGVFCRLNYSICLGNCSFSSIKFWWLVRTILQAWRRILGPHVRRVSYGMTILVCSASHTVVCFVSGQYSMLHRWCQRDKRDVILKNVRTCGGTADVLIAARDWLFFSQSQGA